MFSSVAIIQPHLLHTSIKNYYYNDHSYCYFVDSCSLKFSLDPKDLLIKTLPCTRERMNKKFICSPDGNMVSDQSQGDSLQTILPFATAPHWTNTFYLQPNINMCSESLILK